MAKMNQGQNGFQGNIDAYNYYKKNPAAAQQVLSSMGFNSAQGSSANLANAAMPAQNASPWLSITNPSFLKGLALGVGVAFIATNPTIQKAVIAGSVKLWTSIQGNIEEVKEQIQDIKAELSKEDE